MDYHAPSASYSVGRIPDEPAHSVLLILCVVIYVWAVILPHGNQVLR